MLSRRAALSGLSGLALTAPALRAQTVPTIRIGILQDRSGPASNLGGAGFVACARPREYAGETLRDHLTPR